MNGIIITLPKITAVSLIPNPIEVKAEYKISVGVTEEEISLYATPFAASEIAAGE